MSGGKTLAVAKSLKDAKFEVWTPVEVQKKRKGSARDRLAVEAAIMPTYVFAREDRLADLIAITAAPTSPHPAFSVFRYSGRFPIIADRTLEPLRIAERRRAPPKLPPVLSPGDRVRMTEGAYAGMSGIVESVKSKNGKRVMTFFPGFQLTLEVEALLLLPEMVDTAKPVDGTAAEAA